LAEFQSAVTRPSSAECPRNLFGARSLRRDVVLAAVQVVRHRLALRLDPKPAPTLLAGRDPVVNDETALRDL
jgi:hypothetical protein